MSTDFDYVAAREGDTLVVSYPEVKLPLTTKFGTITVGGLIYTRKLVSGDNAEAEYDRIYLFLKRLAERDAREKVKLWNDELLRAREISKASEVAALPPKPTTRPPSHVSKPGLPPKPGAAR